MISYEYPLNERIRTFLRLENLFRRMIHFSQREDPEDHHIALMALFEMLSVSRSDFKVDLLQELERQRQYLISFQDNPSISEKALSGALYEIEQATSSLLAMSGKIGQYLRENEWLMSVRTRTSVPGGCWFDLPTYHFWLHRDVAQRKHDLESWIRPMLPIRDGLQIVLRLLRDSGTPELHMARSGSYQMMMTGKTAQMVRVRVPKHLDAVPEISANKYALNIRFTLPDIGSRPRPLGRDVDFELTFCNL